MSNLDDIIVRGRTAMNRTRPEPVQVEIVTRTAVPDVIASILTTLTYAWWLMLAIGALSHRYPLPAPSYTDTVLALVVLDCIGYGLRSTHRVWTRERKK